MEKCRICGEDLTETHTKGATRPKEGLRDRLLELTGIDICNDPDNAPTMVHAKCRMQIVRGTYTGEIRDYSNRVAEGGGGDGEGKGGQEEEQGGHEDQQGGHSQDCRSCILCCEHLKTANKQDNVTEKITKLISRTYGLSSQLVNLCVAQANPPVICGKCRHNLERKSLHKLPKFNISVPPLPTTVSSPTKAPRPKRRRKDLLNMKTLVGKGKDVRTARPELSTLLEDMEDFCNEYVYDKVELGFYLLHHILSSEFEFVLARHVRRLHRRGSTMKLSPRKSVANKYVSGRSHRNHRALALFLKQQLGHDVFPARTAEDNFVNAIQPPSYSYKLYSLKDDPACSQPFKTVVGLQQPAPPVVTGKDKAEADLLRTQHKLMMREYKERLAPADLMMKFWNTHCESPVPHALVAIYDYDCLLAAHLMQLAPQIMAKMEEVNRSQSNNKFPSGRLNAKVVVMDGADGFSEMPVISSTQERQLSDHGVTMDFTLISVSIEHVVETSISTGDDEEESLSQALTQTTLDDSSDCPSQNTVSSSLNSQTQSDVHIDGEDDGDGLEDGNTDEEGGYTLVYDERKTNSPFVSRPIFR